VFADGAALPPTRTVAASIPVKKVPRRTAIEARLQLGTGTPPTPWTSRSFNPHHNSRELDEMGAVVPGRRNGGRPGTQRPRNPAFLDFAFAPPKY
jgi:hypothetical protein